MFFRIHNEQKIGFKKLSSADLGLNETSHQTHIGLYEKMLDFLNDADTTDAILIYEGYCDVLGCDFDRIQNPDGTFRSPKIRKGTDGSLTIVKQIRKFAAEHPNRDYYLLWFGLENNEILFWLLDNASADYQSIRGYLPKENHVYDNSEINFSTLMSLVEQKVDNLTISLQEEIEVASQTGVPNRKFRTYDIEKAEKRIKEIGRRGEELVAEYLERQKQVKKISSYIWCNKDRESGKPFDFEVDGTHYIDVKSTQYTFEQKLVFSDSEIAFVSTQNDDTYSVYRVFDMAQTEKKLRICRQCKTYIDRMYPSISRFESDINSMNADVRAVKIAVAPNVMFSNVANTVNL